MAEESPNQGRVYIRPVVSADRREVLALARESRDTHHPWIAPPLTAHMFRQYLRRIERSDHEGFAVCIKATDEIAGIININNVMRGSFLSASLGYYLGSRFVGNGYMVEALNLVKQHAFRRLGLHRIEANIQPDNVRSLNLVKRCGFQHEGLSPAYLYINGAWRDHERWAAVDDRDTLSRTDTWR